MLSANPALLQSFEQHADGVLSAMEREKTRSHDVARVLVERLKGSVPQLGEIARELSMSDRNLQRALRVDGQGAARVPRAWRSACASDPR